MLQMNNYMYHNTSYIICLYQHNSSLEVGLHFRLTQSKVKRIQKLKEIPRDVDANKPGNY